MLLHFAFTPASRNFGRYVLLIADLDGYCDFDDQYGDGSHVAGQVITDVFNLGGGM